MPLSPHIRKENDTSLSFSHLPGHPKHSGQLSLAGADAVYLSGKRFGARKSATNFTDAEIKEAVSLCPQQGYQGLCYDKHPYP